MNGGITDFISDISPDNLHEYLPLSAQIQKLTSPAEMGELFKVIALGKGIAEPCIIFYPATNHGCCNLCHFAIRRVRHAHHGA